MRQQTSGQASKCNWQLRDFFSGTKRKFTGVDADAMDNDDSMIDDEDSRSQLNPVQVPKGLRRYFFMFCLQM